MSTFDLDIIIPVYNEGPNIGRVLDLLAREVRGRFRVLICYDKEDDNTLPALAPFETTLAIVRVKNPSRGPHSAIMAGFRASRADGAVVYPADDDLNAGQLNEMLDMLRSGHEIVCASRFIAGGSMVGCPWLKATLVRVAAFTLHHFARVPTRDATNGFRMFSRRVIRDIEVESSEGFTYAIELLVKAHRLGWGIGEIPAQWRERGKGQGSSRFKVLGWVPAYLRWYSYAFATTFLRLGPATVPLRTEVRHAEEGIR